MIKRSIKADNIKVFLITMVILGHVMVFMRASQLNYVINCIYTFHMPAFIFINGFLLRRITLNKIKKTLLMFIVFQVVYLLAFYLIGYYHSLGGLNLLIPSFHTWYLLAYVFWLMIVAWLNWMNEVSRRLFNLNIVLLFSIAFLIRYTPVIINSQFLTYTRVFVFLPFFLIGYYGKDFFKRQYLSRWLAWIGIIILMGSIIFWTKNGYLPNAGLFFGFGHINELGMSIRRFTILQAYQFVVAFLLTFLITQVITDKTHLYTKIMNNVTYLYLCHPLLAVFLIKFNFNQFNLVTNILLSLIFTVLIIGVLLGIEKIWLVCIKSR